mgnify:CR=1 FL=1
MEVRQPFDFLLDEDCMLGYEKENGIEAGVFGGQKKPLGSKNALIIMKIVRF